MQKFGANGHLNFADEIMMAKTLTEMDRSSNEVTLTAAGEQEMDVE